MVRLGGLRQVCGSRIWQDSSRWLRAHTRCSQKPLFFLFPTFWVLSRPPKRAISQRSDDNMSLFASVFTVVSRPFLTCPSTASLATSSICPDLQNNYFLEWVDDLKKKKKKEKDWGKNFFADFIFHILVSSPAECEANGWEMRLLIPGRW